MRRVLVLGVVVLLGACGSTVRLDNVPVVDRSTGSGRTSGSGTDGAADTTGSSAVGQGKVTSVDLAGNAARTDGTAAQDAGRVIYFDYDSYAIRPEFQAVIDANARYLLADVRRTVRLAGHTDDRGGREYNLALGQKRADAVRRAFALLGVQDKQIESLSYGKEKPAVEGSSDEDRSKNRRVEISYQ